VVEWVGLVASGDNQTATPNQIGLLCFLNDYPPRLAISFLSFGAETGVVFILFSFES
jgi:hypothetical protein